MRTRFAAAGLVAAAVVAGVSGCGASGPATSTAPANPAAALASAVHADVAQPGLAITMSLKTTPAVLEAGGSQITAAQARAILDTRLVLTVHSPGSQPVDRSVGATGEEGSVALYEGSSDLIDLRVVGQVLYARANLNGLAGAYGLPAQMIDSVIAGMSRSAGQVPGVNTLLQGGWVSLNPRQFDAQMGVPVSTPTPAQLGQLRSRLGHVLSGAYQVSYAGTAGSTQRYNVTLRLRQAVDQMISVYDALPGVSGLPGFQQAASTITARIPSTLLPRIGAVVTGGRLTQLSLSLNQFDTSHQIPGPVSMVMDVAGAGPVSVPAGATPLDLGSIARTLLPAAADGQHPASS